MIATQRVTTKKRAESTYTDAHILESEKQAHCLIFLSVSTIMLKIKSLLLLVFCRLSPFSKWNMIAKKKKKQKKRRTAMLRVI